jgi:ketosteroid isomerase-like protein
MTPSFFRRAALGAAALLASAAIYAQPPAPAGSSEDIKAIIQVTEEFQAAIIAKDAKRLSALVLNPHILFTSPASDEYVRKSRETTDVNDDGMDGAGYRSFARLIANTKVPLQEKFYNVKITQDGHVAWVVFDYEFLRENKVSNYGVESWNMVKRDGKWKIFSVVWSAHYPPG